MTPHAPDEATAPRLTRSFFLPSLVAALLCAPAVAQGSLRSVPVPLPQETDTFVRNRDAAARLGKALFWDEQVGGDGRVSCATCHFHAGADSRVENILHPGPNGVFETLLGPGRTVTAQNFPLRGDDVAGSPGIVASRFLGLDPILPVDQQQLVNDGVFFPFRQVTGRNSPSSLLAVYYQTNFWDGRASATFNGVDITGQGGRTVYVDRDGSLIATSIAMQPASAASQAVGPPTSAVEMTCDGRSFQELGRKLLGRMPLATQMVAPDDSLLGPWSLWPLPGISLTYEEMIREAFHQTYHASNDSTAEGYSQMEANFPFYWGLSILLYNARLIPDQTPYDRFADGNRSALTASQRRGLALFEDKARCNQCHGGPLFSAAAIDGGDGGRAFTNIGITPQDIDPGIEKGKFKSPSLRNIDLTGPYFHTGRYLTLRQVVDFYDRGGDVNNRDKDSQVRRLGLTEGEKQDLVAFMLALTDERVRYSRAPFDHPSLNLPNGLPVPAVGAGGRSQPIRRFLDADPFRR